MRLIESVGDSWGWIACFFAGFFVGLWSPLFYGVIDYAFWVGGGLGFLFGIFFLFGIVCIFGSNVVYYYVGSYFGNDFVLATSVFGFVFGFENLVVFFYWDIWNVEACRYIVFSSSFVYSVLLMIVMMDFSSLSGESVFMLGVFYPFVGLVGAAASVAGFMRTIQQSEMLYDDSRFNYVLFRKFVSVVLDEKRRYVYVDEIADETKVKIFILCLFFDSYIHRDWIGIVAHSFDGKCVNLREDFVSLINNLYDLAFTIRY